LALMQEIYNDIVEQKKYSHIDHEKNAFFYERI